MDQRQRAGRWVRFGPLNRYRGPLGPDVPLVGDAGDITLARYDWSRARVTILQGEAAGWRPASVLDLSKLLGAPAR